MDQPKLNMRQCIWFDIVKDYDYEILYHPGKANVVANTLSRKATCEFIRDLCFRIIVVTPLLDNIIAAQDKAMKDKHRKSEQIMGQVSSFNYNSLGLLTLNRRIWVPYLGGSWRTLMEEALLHFLIHPGATKM